MAAAVLYLDHSLVYSNKKPLSVDDVITSLEGMKRITETRLPRALSKLTGAKIKSIDLLVDDFEQGSFETNYWLQLLFEDEAQLKRFLKAFREFDVKGIYRELPPRNKPIVKGTLVAAAVAAIVGYGVASYVSHSGASPKEKALIEANNNTIIAIGAETYNMNPEAFAKIIAEVAGTKKKELAVDAAKILSPAKREKDATVSMGGNPDIAFSHKTVTTMDENLDFGEYETDQSYTNQAVNIRQIDRDSKTGAWKAKVEGIVENRVKLILGDSVSIAELQDDEIVKADITVTFKLTADRKLKPIAITIDKLTPKPLKK